MKDVFAKIEDVCNLASRVDSIESEVYSAVPLRRLEELFGRVQMIEDSYERDEDITTMRWDVQSLREEVRLLRKSIEDYLLYKPEDLKFDDVI